MNNKDLFFRMARKFAAYATVNSFPGLTKSEGAVLRALISQTVGLTGQGIVDTSEGGVGRGSVYVTLARMEEKGFLEHSYEEIEQNDERIPRRVYRITAKGRQVLAAWEVANAVMAGHSVTFG